jgi:DNA mismatch repair protein MSH6
MDDFIVPDDSEEEFAVSKKRKRTSSAKKSNQTPPKSSPPPRTFSDDEGSEIPVTSTARQWNYDPDNLERVNPETALRPPKSSKSSVKEKAHTKEPEKRHTWLANILDADRNPPGHPDYDPRTLYIPPMAWKSFSPFEQQYWEIKSKLWDTVVFFKKGKFYELYENDATIGHQLFDLKLTDRVNMRMVGVPEASLDHWANQFVAKGFKVARVDQMESALGKEMREREDGNKKNKGKNDANKVIRRELSTILTGGTLVDGGMLQDDLSTFCVAVKVRILLSQSFLSANAHVGN